MKNPAENFFNMFRKDSTPKDVAMPTKEMPKNEITKKDLNFEDLGTIEKESSDQIKEDLEGTIESQQNSKM